MDTHQLLKEINQLLIDIELSDNSKDKAIIKAFINLKVKMLTGLVKDM